MHRKNIRTLKGIRKPHHKKSKYQLKRDISIDEYHAIVGLFMLRQNI